MSEDGCPSGRGRESKRGAAICWVRGREVGQGTAFPVHVMMSATSMPPFGYGAGLGEAGQISQGRMSVRLFLHRLYEKRRTTHSPPPSLLTTSAQFPRSPGPRVESCRRFRPFSRHKASALLLLCCRRFRPCRWVLASHLCLVPKHNPQSTTSKSRQSPHDAEQWTLQLNLPKQ